MGIKTLRYSLLVLKISVSDDSCDNLISFLESAQVSISDINLKDSDVSYINIGISNTFGTTTNKLLRKVMIE